MCVQHHPYSKKSNVNIEINNNLYVYHRLIEHSTVVICRKVLLMLYVGYWNFVFVCVCVGVSLGECLLGWSLMNKASHRSGISLTFTADLFILRFKRPGLNYLRGIKQWREYTHVHTHKAETCICAVQAVEGKQEPDDTFNSSKGNLNRVYTSHHSHWCWSCDWLQGWCWRRMLRQLWPSQCIVSPDWQPSYQPVKIAATPHMLQHQWHSVQPSMTFAHGNLVFAQWILNWIFFNSIIRKVWLKSFSLYRTCIKGFWYV